MIKKLLKSFIGILATASLMLMVACGPKGGENSSNEPDNVYFEQTEYTLNIGEAVTLNLQGDIEGEIIRWKSSNHVVASVENGLVTGLLAGTANITANVNGIEATCTIKVVFDGEVEEGVESVYSVRLDYTKASLLPQNQLTISATVYKNDLTVEDNVEWVVADAEILQLESDGNMLTITGLQEGKTTIYAKVGKATAKCEVVVGNQYHFVLTNDLKELMPGDEPYQITGLLYKNGAIDATTVVEWESEDESVATVNSNGWVTAVKGGSTRIKAFVGDNEWFFSIKVKNVIDISTKEEFLQIGKTSEVVDGYRLTADITLENADYTRIEVENGVVSATWDRVAYLVEELACTLDGNGYTIYTTYDKDVVGADGKVEAYPALFYTIAQTGVLKNVKIQAFTRTNFETTSVARYNYGLVENCYIDAQHVYQDEASKVNGPDVRQWIRNCTGEIVDNYGTVRNCVFKIITQYADGTYYTNTYAIRKNHEGSKVENCTVIGNTAAQFFSNSTVKALASWGDPSITDGNKDEIRTNCYVFANIADLMNGNGGKYNADGTITAGTYTEVKDFYMGSYWETWGFTAA